MFELTLDTIDLDGEERQSATLRVGCPPSEWTAEDVLSVLHEIMESALAAPERSTSGFSLT